VYYYDAVTEEVCSTSEYRVSSNTDGPN
jgi:hypothetical protein